MRSTILPSGCTLTPMVQAYVQARHPIAAFDARRHGPFPTPLSQLRNSPCFTFGERPVPKRAAVQMPGPNHYSNVCAALDKLSKAHFSPSFSIRGKLPVCLSQLHEGGWVLQLIHMCLHDATLRATWIGFARARLV